MSTSRTINNLNIRKFSNKAAFDSATIGEDDICVLLNDGTPLMYTTALPEPSASVENAVYYLISDYQGQTGWYQGQRIYKCNFDGSNYYWSMLYAQENTNYGSRYSEVLNVNSSRTAFRFANTSSLPLGGFIVQMSDGMGSEFVAVIVGDAGVYRQTTLRATGAFEGLRFGSYKLTSTRYYILNRKDNSPLFNSSTRVTYTVTGLGNDANSYQYGRIIAVTLNSSAVQARTWFEIISGSQTPDMPEITHDILGQTRQYTGATDATYTNGYFYKATGTEVVTPAAMATTVTSPSGEAAVNIDATSFITNFCSWTGWSVADLEQNLNNTAQQTWVINYSIDNSGVVEVYVPFYGWVGDTNIIQCFSVTYTGSSSSGNVDINFTVAYTPAEHTVQDGAWERVDVQPAPSGLPDQTGNAGKFLTTDGTDASWSNKPIVNAARNPSQTVFIGSTQTSTQSDQLLLGVGSSVAWAHSVTIGNGVTNNGYDGSLAIGCGATTGAKTGSSSLSVSTAVGCYATAKGRAAITVGKGSTVDADGAIQIGNNKTNTDDNTFKVGNLNGNFEIMSADGTIPADRLTHAINKYSTMPTASASNEGWIVQFTGTTDSTYTHGYIYECKAQGTDPETYAWEAVEVQASSGGLPSQTGNAGKFLTTDGTDASWSDKPLVNKSTSPSGSLLISDSANVGSVGTQAIGIGFNSLRISGSRSIAIGYGARATAAKAVSIGGYATATCAIQLGTGGSGTYYQPENSDANTFKVANENGNFEIMSADGTIPTARFATDPVADGTYVPTVTVSSGVATRAWTAPSGAAPTITWYTVSTAGSTLTIADTSSASLVKIYKNGLLLEPTADYSISGTTLTMVTALVVGDKITTEVF